MMNPQDKPIETTQAGEITVRFTPPLVECLTTDRRSWYLAACNIYRSGGTHRDTMRIIQRAHELAGIEAPDRGEIDAAIREEEDRES